MTNFRLPWQQRVRMQREQEAERHALSCYCGFRTQHNKIFHFASSCITYHGTAHVSFVSVLGDAHRWYSHKSAYLKQRGRERGGSWSHTDYRSLFPWTPRHMWTRHHGETDSTDIGFSFTDCVIFFGEWWIFSLHPFRWAHQVHCTLSTLCWVFSLWKICV